MDADLARLARLITFLPYNVVEAAIVDGVLPQPSVRWEEGCLLTLDLSVVPPRYERRGAAGADEEVSRVGADLSQALRRILEEAVFPRGGYLLKFSPSGVVVMFTARAPGQGPSPWSHSSDVAGPAQRASRCAVEMLHILRVTFPNRFTLRAGAELGRFRLALCGRPGVRLEQLVLGSLCRTVAQLRDVAGPGELVVGPRMVAALAGWQAHIGPTRGTGRRLMNVPPDVAGEPARVADLQTLMAQNTQKHLAALRPLMPPGVAERVEAGESPLSDGGEVRPVAVAAFPLEVDYPDDADSEAVLLDLTAGVTALWDAVKSHGGTLLQLDVLAGGSAAICVFGTRDTLRNASRQAVSCALDLSQALVRNQSRWSIRAGIEAGRAYLGDIGSPLKRELSVVGGPAVVAADLSSHAARGQVLVGETGWRLLGGRGQGRSIGQLSVGRPPRSWPVFEVKGLKAADGAVPSAREEPSADDSTDESPRARMQLRLERMLHQATTYQQGGAVVLHGPMGSGKTDIVSALADEAAHLGFRGSVVRCPRTLAHSPPSPLALWLRELLHLPRHTPPESLHSEIRGGVAEVLKEGQRAPLWLWKLLGLLELPHDPAVDPLLPQPDALEVVGELLSLRSKETPLLLVMEDLHAADVQTLTVTAALMKQVPRWPVVLVVTLTHDPERGAPVPPHVAAALQKSGARWLPVPAATAPEALQQLATEMGVPEPSWLEMPLDVLLSDLARTGTMPKVVRERAGCCRARMAQGRSFADAWTEARDIGDPRELWQLRLDALPTEQRDLLRLAAVLGLEFEAVLLWKTLQREPQPGTLGDTMGRLSTLVQERLLTSTVVGGVVGYRFRSAILRDVAYESWPPDARARWHSHAAEALHLVPWTEASGGPGRVAHHLLHGSEPARAAAPLLTAAQHMQSLLHLEEAGELYEHVLVLDTHQAGAALALAQVELARGRTLEADRVASGLTDDLTSPLEVRAHAWLTRSHAALMQGDHPGAALAAKTGRKLLPRGQAHALRTRLAAAHVDALWREGQPDRAILYTEQVTAQLSDVAAMPLNVDTRPQDAVLHAALVELEVARAGALHAQGSQAEAVRLLETLLKRSALTPLHHCGALVRQQLGHALLTESPQSAANALASAVDMLHALGHRQGALHAALTLCRALIRARQVEGALATRDHLLLHTHLLHGFHLGMLHALSAQLSGSQDGRVASTLLDQARSIVDGCTGRNRVTLLLEMARAAERAQRIPEGKRWLEEARTVAVAAAHVDMVSALDQENTLRG